MTPKEKAKELVHQHLNINLSQVDSLVDGIRIRLAQESALICVNEIIKTICYCYPSKNEKMSFVEYWEEVKKELELKNATKP